MKLPVFALVLACASCRTIETRSVASTPPPAVRVGERARVWDVRRGTERLGQVVLFQEHGLAGDSVFVVRNAWNQDLGLIDGLGRAYRFLPHLEEPAWVGSGTITLGAARILAVEECALVELGSEPESGPGTTTLAVGEASDRDELEPSARPSNAPVSDGGLPQSH